MSIVGSGGKFPKILHHLLQQGLACIRWHVNGEVVILENGSDLFDALAPFMNSRSFNTVQRQMNYYGFSKVDTVSGMFSTETHYIHPHYRRNKPDSVYAMVRVPLSSSSARSPASAQSMRQKIKSLEQQLKAAELRIRDLEEDLEEEICKRSIVPMHHAPSSNPDTTTDESVFKMFELEWTRPPSLTSVQDYSCLYL
jgi:hypothetical protein